MKQIIGIGGTNGSGKDTVGQLLAEEFGFLFISVTDILRAECRDRGLPVVRENLREISAEWRRELGMGAPIDRGIAVYDKSGKNYKGVVLASLRHPGESDRVHELGGTVWWIDADPQVRYERVRAGNRGRSEEDEKTFEEFMADEAAEMTPPPDGGPTALNAAAVRDGADVMITNGGDLDALREQILRSL